MIRRFHRTWSSPTPSSRCAHRDPGNGKDPTMTWTTIGKLTPLALAVALPTVPRPTQAVGTTFPYQGQLQQNGTPRNGTCDFQFTLFDAPTDGNQVGTPVPKPDVTLKNGFFTVELDFGAVFTGANVWL